MDVIVKSSPKIEIQFTTEVVKVIEGVKDITIDSALSTTSANPVQNKVVTQVLDKKVDKVVGKGLSTNDYTNEDKSRVMQGGIPVRSVSGLYDAALAGSMYGPLEFSDAPYEYRGVYFITQFSGDSGVVHALALVYENWASRPKLLSVYYEAQYETSNIRAIPIMDVITSQNLASQVEIDALFDKTGNDSGSGSYGSY